MASPAITVSYLLNWQVNKVHAGICNYHLGQYEEAIAHYDIAKAKWDQYSGNDSQMLGNILYNRGVAYSSLMRFEQAIAD